VILTPLDEDESIFLRLLKEIGNANRIFRHCTVERGATAAFTLDHNQTPSDTDGNGLGATGGAELGED
jgi:hypothetical protein